MKGTRNFFVLIFFILIVAISILFIIGSIQAFDQLIDPYPPSGVVSGPYP